MDNQVRKLSKTGSGSYYVVIPKEIIKELGWQKAQKLVIKKFKDGVKIVDWEKEEKKS